MGGHVAKKIKNKRVMSEEHKKKIASARTKYLEQKKAKNADGVSLEDSGKSSGNSSRFQPNHEKLGGRVKGVKNKRTLWLESITDEALTAANTHLNQLLIDGNPEALKMHFDRIYPKPASINVPTFTNSDFKLPAVKSGADINNAMEVVLLAVQDGVISLEEGEYWYDKLERKIKALAHFEWEPFIEKMLELKKRGEI